MRYYLKIEIFLVTSVSKEVNEEQSRLIRWKSTASNSKDAQEDGDSGHVMVSSDSMKEVFQALVAIYPERLADINNETKVEFTTKQTSGTVDCFTATPIPYLITPISDGQIEEITRLWLEYIEVKLRRNSKLPVIQFGEPGGGNHQKDRPRIQK